MQVQLQALDDGLAETRVLVGDDAPGQAAGAQLLQQWGHVVEEARFLKQPLLVALEDFVAQGLKLFVAGKHLKRHTHHAARTGAHHAAQLRVRHRRQAARGAHVVGGAGQVGRAVDEGAVEVEEDGADGGLGRRGGHVGIVPPRCGPSRGWRCGHDGLTLLRNERGFLGDLSRMKECLMTDQF